MKEIDMKKLLWEMLEFWRLFLASIVIGVILLGGWSYFNSGKEVENSGPQIEITSITEEEKEKVNTILAYEDIYEQKKKYLDGSVMMSMDVENVPTTEMLYVISSDDQATSKEISKTYEMLLTGTDICNKIANIDEKIAPYLTTEILKITRDSNIYKDDQGDGRQLFSIKVIYNDMKGCQEIAKIVDEYLQSKHSIVEKGYGSHEIVLVNQVSSNISDYAILDYQTVKLSELTSFTSTISSLKSELTGTESQYYSLLKTKSEVTTNSSAEQTTANRSIDIKYVLIGVLIGLFVPMCIILIIKIFSPKVSYDDNVEDYFGIKKIGGYFAPSSQKRCFSNIDRMIQSKRYGKRNFELSGEMNSIVSSRIKEMLKTKGVDTVGIIGNNFNEKTVKICNELKSNLEQCGIYTIIIENAFFDSESIEKISEIQDTILIVQEERTLQSDIKAQIEIVKEQGTQILGYIIIGKM